MEKNLIGYLLEALDPDETRAVEAYLSEHPEARRHLEHLRSALAPLDVDGADEAPPEDLVVRTLAGMAEHIVRHEDRASGRRETPVTDFIRNYARLVDGIDVPDKFPDVRPADPPVDRETALSRQNARNVFAACGLSLALLALAVPGVLAFREYQQIVACQNNLRLFHASIGGYEDVHDGRLPRVAENQVAASFVTTLSKSGLLSPDARPACPATGHSVSWTTAGGELVSEATPSLIEYSYTLGYRDGAGELHGVSRQEEPDNLPILADTPTPALSPRLWGTATATNHPRGQNVLYLGGNVRFCTNALVGIDRDNIYCNQAMRVMAGINEHDTVLGRADERP